MAPYWSVPCQTSAPAASIENVSPSWPKSASVEANVVNGGSMPTSPTVNATLRESLLRPSSFVATAWAT